MPSHEERATMSAIATPPPPEPTGAAPGGIPLLAELPAELLEEVARGARRLRLPAGRVVIHEGAPGDGLYLLVAGELEVTRRCGGQEVVLAVFGPGALLGEMSLLERSPRSASVRTTRDSELLAIESADFQALLERSPALSSILLRTVLLRLRSTEASLIQHAKLASLGTLTAGLAHELNNPAAALLRGLPQLADALVGLDRGAAAVGGLGLHGELEARLERLAAGAPDPVAAARSAVGGMEAEDRLLDWLEARGVEDPARLAPPLLAGGWTPERLRGLVDGIDGEHVPPALRWLAARCAASTLVEELTRSAAGVSDIVGAVRAHASLGRPSVREQDVAGGIESTLLVLRGRLRDGIEVRRDYAPDLPPVEAYGGELNQVWANLVENAIDAMQGRGTLDLRVAGAEDGVVVQVVDSGPGIPPDVQPRVFDPFFTTKPVGEGMGLGLHIAYQIVRRHRGSIHVDSRPGRTAFTVELPLRLRAEP
jgi:signal transduction histidine kinase